MTRTVSGALLVTSPSTRARTDAQAGAAMAMATRAEIKNFMTRNKLEQKKSSVG
jgi:hypothetical protein